ncbi:TetR/AcrR family transcriptional regulator [Tahibacter amnicola]|uniref:TetR/AcrR family transcriptional regulator n=1 Tax=Tahibacter amnicola TaxID=2976241 RepID=A0ABY6BCR9_9GAMM|nr:TetR/AcrR family transcriptional regulator [Tahibacter amnicola]UXI67838.1 TetR/AcrR family transcriptional regulator [Tahibacter amnicola]
MNRKKPSPTTAPAAARGRGRPASAAVDREARERLIDAAVTLFSERGIAATPLSAVARAAHVTPALLHYYFGNKENLVDAIVEERFVPIVSQVVHKLSGIEATPRAAFTTFVQEVTATLSTHPWLPPLWLREVVTEGGQLRERIVGHMAPRLAQPLVGLVRQAQAEGRLNPAIEPRLIMVSLIGLTVFPFAAQGIWRPLFEAGDVTAESLARHVLALLLDGLLLPDK